MNPCDWFKPPELRVRTEVDTEITGSCNCCRDNQCQSSCGLCCFPFFRRRRREKDDQIQQVFDERVTRQEVTNVDTERADKDRKVDCKATRKVGEERLERVKKNRRRKKKKGSQRS